MIVQKQGLSQIDYPLVVSIVALCLGGILAIESARHTDLHPQDLVRKQTVGVGIGIVAMLLVATSDYASLLKRYARYLYPINLVLLVAVLVGHVGHASHGAQRWIGLGPFQLQPSEFAKLVLICTLAMFLTKNLNKIHQFSMVSRSFVHVAVPMVLIARQPDLGTALVILTIWFGMLAMAGAKASHLLLFFVAGVVLFAGMWHFNVGLKDYQKNRLEVFLKPDADPRDAGYHLRQSEIAIGSGGLTGEGFEQGLQANGRFIPEQQTDFIFTVLGEEGGFVVCAALLAVYLFVLMRGLIAMADCDDVLGRLVAAGVLSLLTFHIVVNMGMTMGVMPVVGVPLPFFSYGLSSLLVNFIAVGLLLSVAARKHRVMF